MFGFGYQKFASLGHHTPGCDPEVKVTGIEFSYAFKVKKLYYQDSDDFHFCSV